MVLNEGAPPLWAAAIRQTVAALVFLIVLLIRRPSLRIGKGHLKLILLYGVFMMSLAHIFAFVGQQYIYSGLASIVFSFFPLAVILISAILIPEKEPLTWRKVLGAFLGIMGVTIIFSRGPEMEFNTAAGLGVLFVLLSVFTNALPNVIIKRDGRDLDPLVLNAGGMLTASALLLTIAFTVRGVPDFPFTRRLILAELYLGIFCSAAAFFLYFWLMRHISVFKLSLSAYLTPIVAVFLGFVFYNEILSRHHYIGMLFIFAGIFMTEFKHYARLLRKKL
jgi:drug/metabolite transporter (DMT)-like permease